MKWVERLFGKADGAAKADGEASSVHFREVIERHKIEAARVIRTEIRGLNAADRVTATAEEALAIIRGSEPVRHDP